MADKAITSKFKLGQKVWTIRNGYVEHGTIGCLLRNKHDEVLVSFGYIDFNDGKYYYDSDEMISAEDVYVSKKALLKHLENQEDYE